MMHLSLGSEVVVAFAVICTVWIAVQVVRNARRLNAGVRAFKAEQEKQDGVVDPYAALSSLSTPMEKPPEKPRSTGAHWRLRHRGLYTSTEKPPDKHD